MQEVFAKRQLLIGSRENLVTLIGQYPQVDKQGQLLYALGAGMAVDLLTGSKRTHSDIDLVALSEVYLPPLYDICDCTRFFCRALNLDVGFVRSTCLPVSILVGRKFYQIWCIHPAILTVQKATEPARSPRLKDMADRSTLADFCQRNRGLEIWQREFREALLGVRIDFRDQTTRNLRQMLGSNIPRLNFIQILLSEVAKEIREEKEPGEKGFLF